MSHMRWQILVITALLEALRPPCAGDAVLLDIQQKVTTLSTNAAVPVCPAASGWFPVLTFVTGLVLGGLALQGYWSLTHVLGRRRSATSPPRRRGSGVLMDARAEHHGVVLR